MAGAFSASGLITGIDSGSLIRQLMQLERQPILRVQQRISSLETRRDTLGEIRTQLLDLRNAFKDIQLGTKFNQFSTISSDESILTASSAGGNPISGAFSIEVLQLASATLAVSSDRLGASINAASNLNSSGMTQSVSAGTYTINGVQLTVDPASDTVNGIVNAINASGAGVTATYDAVTDTVSLENTTPGDTSYINLGGSDDTSNLLEALHLNGATQFTGGSGSTVVTSSTNLGAVNSGTLLSATAFAGGAVTAGSFQINGTTIIVDPSADTLEDIISRINTSDAGVTVNLDPTTDTLRVVSDNLGSRTVSFTSGTSNFLDVTNLTAATQTVGSDAQYTIDGGAVQTSNSNTVLNAISGVEVKLLSAGVSTLTVGVDDEAILEEAQALVDTFNETITAFRDQLKQDGGLENDSSIRSIMAFLTGNVFQQVPGIGGGLESLLDIGISSGDGFSAGTTFQLQIDSEKFRAAILENRQGVEDLFTNSDGTGIIDSMFDYIDEASSNLGFLHDRSKSGGSIDKQIDALNDRIDQMERRVSQKEARLRRQFLHLETMSGSLQTQGASLAGLVPRFGSF